TERGLLEGVGALSEHESVGGGAAGEVDDVEEHLEGDIGTRDLGDLGEISLQIRPDPIETGRRGELGAAERRGHPTGGVRRRCDGPAEGGQKQVRGGVRRALRHGTSLTSVPFASLHAWTPTPCSAWPTIRPCSTPLSRSVIRSGRSTRCTRCAAGCS